MRLHNSLFLFLSQRRWFWNAKRLVTHWAFIGHRECFGLGRLVRRHLDEKKTFGSLVSQVVGDFLYVLIAATALQVTNHWFVDYASAVGVSIPKDSEYGTLLASAVALGSVLIGLYYAATSAIVGVAYSSVPNDIRSLLTQERRGNVYMRFLARVTFFGVVLLAFRTAGYPPLILALPVLIFSAGVSIIAFVRLGMQAFGLFDPTVLSGYIFEEIKKSSSQVAAGSFQWLDPSFQNHAHRIARYKLDTLSTLSDLTAKSSHLNGEPFALLCKNIVIFLIWYSSAKRRIPNDSLWHSQEYRHPDWYRTSDTTTSLIHQTATKLPHEIVFNTNWVEDELLPILSCCIRINLENGRFDVVLDLLGYVDAYVRRLAREYQVEEAFSIISNVSKVCSKFVVGRRNPTGQSENLNQLAIADSVAAMPISVMLEYLDAIGNLNREKIDKEVGNINWSEERDIYSQDLPAHTFSELHWIYSRVELETHCDGRKVSPDWYLAELIVKNISNRNAQAIQHLFEGARELYEDWIKFIKKRGSTWVEASVLSREEEYWNKIGAHFYKLQAFWNGFDQGKRIDGLSWPKVDFDALGKTSQTRSKEIIREMAEDAVELGTLARPENYPDFGGKFLHTTGEAIVSALHENDAKFVLDIFPSYFSASLLQFDRLKPGPGDVDLNAQNAMKIAFAPILDLMDVSGYAFFYSEYFGNFVLRDIVIATWDVYLDNKEQAERQQLLQLLAATVAFTDGSFEIAHRSLLRTRWRQQAFHRTVELPRERVVDGGGMVFVDTIHVHDSPLVRLIANDRAGLRYDGIDIFISKILRREDCQQELDFGRLRSRDLLEALEREEKRYRKLKNVVGEKHAH